MFERIRGQSNPIKERTRQNSLKTPRYSLTSSTHCWRQLNLLDLQKLTSRHLNNQPSTPFNARSVNTGSRITVFFYSIYSRARARKMWKVNRQRHTNASSIIAELPEDSCTCRRCIFVSAFTRNLCVATPTAAGRGAHERGYRPARRFLHWKIKGIRLITDMRARIRREGWEKEQPPQLRTRQFEWIYGVSRKLNVFSRWKMKYPSSSLCNKYIYVLIS